MALRDITPRFELIDTNAQRFAARMTRGGRLGVLRLPFLEDAWGGIDAGQPELVLEALLSMLDNGIVVYLAYRDIEVPAGVTPIEALSQVEEELGRRAWGLASESAGPSKEVEARLKRVMRFVEFELGVMGAVPSWAGRVTEPEYLQYRYDAVYPAILLAEQIGALQFFPVPGTYVDAAHEAHVGGHVAITRLSGN